MLRKFSVAVAVLAIGSIFTTAALARPDLVYSPGGYSAGSIVVKTNERRLYLVLGDGYAVRYPVGVGKPGKQWAGSTRIDGKYRNPAWCRSQTRQAEHSERDRRRVSS